MQLTSQSQFQTSTFWDVPQSLALRRCNGCMLPLMHFTSSTNFGLHALYRSPMSPLPFKILNPSTIFSFNLRSHMNLCERYMCQLQFCIIIPDMADMTVSRNDHGNGYRAVGSYQGFKGMQGYKTSHLHRPVASTEVEILLGSLSIKFDTENVCCLAVFHC